MSHPISKQWIRDSCSFWTAGRQWQRILTKLERGCCHGMLAEPVLLSAITIIWSYQHPHNEKWYYQWSMGAETFHHSFAHGVCGLHPIHLSRHMAIYARGLTGLAVSPFSCHRWCFEAVASPRRSMVPTLPATVTWWARLGVAVRVVGDDGRSRGRIAEEFASHLGSRWVSFCNLPTKD